MYDLTTDLDTTQAKIVECQHKGFYHIFDEKYFPKHKCKEKKLFLAILEDIYDDEVEAIPPKALHPSVECIPLTDKNMWNNGSPCMP